MVVLYNFFISVAPAILKLISPLSPKIKLWLNAVHNWEADINDSDIHSRPCNVWFHCASLGEFEQGKPVMQAMKQLYPQISIVVTFFSPSGYSARKNSPIADYVGYLPIDSKDNAQQFVEIIQPKMAFFIKSEIWPNFISVLKSKHVPTFLLSARFHERQTLFKWQGKFFRNQLRKFDLIFVQNKSSKILLKKYNIDSIYAGDTRFDQVVQLLDNIKDFRYIDKFKNNKPLLIAGSCWEEDLVALHTYIFENDTKVIIATHDVSEKMIQKAISLIGTSAVRYSQLNNETDLSGIKVLIIDSIGMLASLYAQAQVAYVGGAFKQGLHNILEPAVYHIPVVFGPEIDNFPEATEMIKAGGAYRIENDTELNQVLKTLFNNESLRLKAGSNNDNYIQNKRGATEKVMTSVKTTVGNLDCFKTANFSQTK